MPIARLVFILLAVGSVFVSPAIALFGGIAFALVFTVPFPKAGKIGSKYLLQAAVVGLGVGLWVLISVVSLGIILW